MNSEKASPMQSAVKRKWYDSMPIELHGHRKKLDFFLASLEQYRTARGVAASAISILEIGCSNGKNVSLPLAEHGFDVTGVDLHQPSIEWANIHNEFPNARFICQDAAEFVSERFFDVIVLSDILEHVDEPLQLLELAQRLLKPGGMVLICIPNGFGPAEIERKLVETIRLDRLLQAMRIGVNRLRGRQSDTYNNDSGHVQYFRMKSIERLIAQSGFVVEARGKGALFGGNLTYPVGTLFRPVVTASLFCASHLPFRVISTWYFRLSRAATEQLPRAGER